MSRQHFTFLYTLVTDDDENIDLIRNMKIFHFWIDSLDFQLSNRSTVRLAVRPFLFAIDWAGKLSIGCKIEKNV